MNDRMYKDIVELLNVAVYMLKTIFLTRDCLEPSHPIFRDQTKQFDIFSCLNFGTKKIKLSFPIFKRSINST